MSNIKHTREPWHLLSHRGSKTVAILDAKKRHQPEVVKWGGFDEEPFSLQDANAKRIVAAVNFCEDFSNEDLAKMGSLKEYCNWVEKQRLNIFRISNQDGVEFLETAGVKYYPQTQWHSYDKNDKGTWPEKNKKHYLVWLNTGWSEQYFWDKKFPWEIITHYQLITPPKDKT